MRVLLTDKPAAEDVQAVNVTIVRVDLVYDSASGLAPVRIDPPVKSFNLLDLRNGVTAVLGIARIPAGPLAQVRLILGEASVVVDGASASLKIPSGPQTGIKLLANVEVSPCNLTTLTLDFDAEHSIHHNQGQGWMLKPVIKVDATVVVRTIEEVLLVLRTSSNDAELADAALCVVRRRSEPQVTVADLRVALGTVSRLQVAEARPDLLAILADTAGSEYVCRALAAAGLGAIARVDTAARSPEVTEALATALRTDASPAVKQAAARALGSVGTEPAFVALRDFATSVPSGGADPGTAALSAVRLVALQEIMRLRGDRVAMSPTESWHTHHDEAVHVIRAYYAADGGAP